MFILTKGGGMGRNKKITFSLKPVLSYFGGCFVFVCLFVFLKKEQLFLDLNIVIKERKTGQTGQEG